MASNALVAGCPIHVYGHESSPWTAAVLAALTLKGLSPRTTVLCFPGPRTLLKNSFAMPVLWAGGKCVRGSQRIMQFLDEEFPERQKLSGGDHEEEEKAERNFERLFFEYALTRTGGAVRFWREWSLHRDCHPSAAARAAATFLRPFLTLYFFALINMGRVERRLLHRRLVFDAERFRAELTKWESMLTSRASGGPFLGGKRVTSLDLWLFGHVEAMCCGLSDETLPVLCEFPTLNRTWLPAMHQSLSAAGYRFHRFSTRLLPTADARGLGEVRRATKGEQALFWAGALTLALGQRWTLRALLAAVASRYLTRERSFGKFSTSSLKDGAEFVIALALLRAVCLRS